MHKSQYPCWFPACCTARGARRRISHLHQFRALTSMTQGLGWHTSTVERVGSYSSCQSEVGRVIQPGGATRRAPRPEKTDRPCEGWSGSGTAKAVIASRGCDGACLRVAGSLAGVGCWSITNVAALSISLPVPTPGSDGSRGWLGPGSRDGGRRQPRRLRRWLPDPTPPALRETWRASARRQR